MPPKLEKCKKEKGSKKKISTPLDEVDTTILTRAQLEEFCVNVHKALTEEKHHSDVLRLERDKLVNMVAIAREHLVLAKHENYDKQMDLDDAEENHRLQMKNRRMQLINLKCEKNIDCLNTKLASAKIAENTQANHEKILNEVNSDITELKSKLLNVGKRCSETKTNQEIENAEQRHKLREEEKEMHVLIEHTWDKKLNMKINSLNDDFNQEYEKLRNRKLTESSQLVKYNDKFTYALNHYYKNIVYHNLNLIMRLRNNLQEMKTEFATVETNVTILRARNKELRESLNNANSEKQTLEEKLIHAARDQKELKITMKELNRKNVSLENLKLELDTLNMAVDKRDKIVNKLNKEKEERLFMIKIMAEEIILVLEYLAVHLRHKLDELDKLYSSIKCTPSEPCQPAKDSLTWDLGTVAFHHDKVLQNYHDLLDKYGIHPDNTGFTPLLAEEILKRVNYLRILVNEEII